MPLLLRRFFPETERSVTKHFELRDIAIMMALTWAELLPFALESLGWWGPVDAQVDDCHWSSRFKYRDKNWEGQPYQSPGIVSPGVELLSYRWVLPTSPFNDDLTPSLYQKSVETFIYAGKLMEYYFMRLISHTKGQRYLPYFMRPGNNPVLRSIIILNGGFDGTKKKTWLPSLHLPCGEG